MDSSISTDEMIEQAVPKTRKKTGDRRVAIDPAATVTVPDADRKKVPYQNVGLLIFFVNGQSTRGTAYATNASGAKNVVFTAAHNLVDKVGDSADIRFIPALQTDKSRPFGEFRQIAGGKGTAFFVHPDYDVIKDQEAYDLGAVKLQRNAAGKELGDVVSLLNIVVDKTYTTSDSFTAIGYPETFVMKTNAGNFINKEDMGETVNKHGELDAGASGGPWLFKGNDVNGNTSAGESNEESSPYYSKAKIDAILNQL